MRVIEEAVADKFISDIALYKDKVGEWIGFYAGLSEKLEHQEVISNLNHITGVLHQHQKKADELLKLILALGVRDDKACRVYKFTDGDVFFFIEVNDIHRRDELRQQFHEFMETHNDLCSMSLWGDDKKDIYDIQKLSVQKQVSEKRICAYLTMADPLRVKSIEMRRERNIKPIVLIIDDDRFTATFAANMLLPDFEFIHATSGEDGILEYIEYAPDVVLLDIHMTGIDGHDTLRAIKAVDPKAVVVMLSVDTIKDNIVGAAEGGASAFLKKPFTKDRLLTAVTKSLTQHGSVKLKS